MSEHPPVGKFVGGFLYVHRSAVNCLANVQQDRVNKATALVPELQWNVVKLSAKELSVLVYEDFDQSAFPALLLAAKVDISTGQVTKRLYEGRPNPPILHRKETLLRSDDPRIPTFSALTRAAESHGLFEGANAIGTRQAWEKKIAAAGLILVGHILAKPGEQHAVVARHRTAISRRDLSQPVAIMLRNGILASNSTVFDYGCGQGGDIAALQENGYTAFGWDPHFAPEGPRKAADVVNLGFVLNVIENPFERVETLKSAWSFTKRVLTVSVMLTHQQQGTLQPYKDGVLTSRGTFQRYFTQDELRDLVASATGEMPVTLGPGVVSVFRDKELEQEAIYRRRSRAVAIAEDFTFTPRLARAAQAKPAIQERIADILEAIWRQALAYGRFPGEEELSDEVVSALSTARVSIRRALSLASQMYPAGKLKQAGDARREDILIHTALSLFPGAPKYSALPKSIQRDIKTFFGNHAAAIDRARRLLFSVGDTAGLAVAMESAASSGFGGAYANKLRFLSGSLLQMPTLIRLFFGCAEVIDPDLSAYDFLEIDIDEREVRGIRCINPTARLPIIAEISRVNVRTLQGRRMRPRGAVLYLRGAYLPTGFEGLDDQRRIDEKLIAAGIITLNGEGPDASNLSRLLKDRGLSKSG